MAIRPPPRQRRRILFAPGWHDEEVLLGVAEIAVREGWALDAPLRHQTIVPGDWDGDGMITSHAPRQTALTALQQRLRRLPTVWLTRPDGASGDAVCIDNAACAALGVQHLVMRGYRHLAYAFASDDAHSVQRRDGFAAACAGSGVAATVVRLPRLRDRAAVRAALKAGLAAVEQRIGILGAQDAVAAACMGACIELGWQVPAQVGVVGIDDDRLVCEFQEPRLSSVDSARRQVGLAAGERLAQRFLRERPPALALVPPAGLTARASTGMAAAGDPVVVAALACIEQRLADPLLSVDALAEATGRSRRGLHDAFVRDLGHPVGDEIVRQRLALARELLGSGLTLVETAARCGYGSADALSRAIRRELGVAPASLRH